MWTQLNPAQRDAVTTLSGPLLVLAGAGTGKTRVVTCRIARLIQGGVAPQRILAVTFTNKAAAEMRERALKLLRRRDKQQPEVSTFHSLCVRILRRNITRLGYPANFTIYDRGAQESAARAALREINVPGALLRPGDLLAIIGRWKTAAIRPPQAAAQASGDREHLAAMAYRRYQQALAAAGAVDFDDLLLCTEDLFQQFPAVRRDESQRFDHVLVDEYQDTNRSQYRILRDLAAGHRNLCVVGDDDQSIYGWRGAEVEHILRFQHDWPEAKVVRLEENYRCTAEILQLANRLIRFNRLRHEKTLRAARSGGEKPRILQFPDEATEAREIVQEIARRLDAGPWEPRDFAVLFRTNEQPRAFETELRAARLPYVLIGGLSFFDRKEIRDLLAYLRLLVAPGDEVALLRIINKPPRGIGQDTVKALLDVAVRQGRPLGEVLAAAQREAHISSAAAEAVARFRQLIDQFRARAARERLAVVVKDLIDAVGYRQELTRLYPTEEEVAARWAAVEELVNALAAYENRTGQPSLQGFLDEVALTEREFEGDKEKQLTRNAIALMTLHSAKGLEFPHVYLVGLEEGLLPHHRSVAVDGPAIDEERRLCYVGITRAQERLTLSLALSRMRWGAPRPTHASRFLFEMTGQADRFRPAARSSAAPAKPAAKRGSTRRPASGPTRRSTRGRS